MQNHKQQKYINILIYTDGGFFSSSLKSLIDSCNRVLNNEFLSASLDTKNGSDRVEVTCKVSELGGKIYKFEEFDTIDGDATTTTTGFFRSNRVCSSQTREIMCRKRIKINGHASSNAYELADNTNNDNYNTKHWSTLKHKIYKNFQKKLAVNTESNSLFEHSGMKSWRNQRT